VFNTRCDEPAFLGSTFKTKCAGKDSDLNTLRSPSSFSRIRGVVFVTLVDCGAAGRCVTARAKAKTVQVLIAKMANFIKPPRN
jgi:hypothetical protein